MTTFDPEKARRVWQRVQAQNYLAPPPLIREDRTLPELIHLTQELSDEYRRLALRYTDPERNRLLQMSNQAKSHSAFLQRLLEDPRRSNRGRR